MRLFKTLRTVLSAIFLVPFGALAAYAADCPDGLTPVTLGGWHIDSTHWVYSHVVADKAFAAKECLEITYQIPGGYGAGDMAKLHNDPAILATTGVEGMAENLTAISFGTMDGPSSVIVGVLAGNTSTVLSKVPANELLGKIILTRRCGANFYSPGNPGAEAGSPNAGSLQVKAWAKATFGEGVKIVCSDEDPAELRDDTIYLRGGFGTKDRVRLLTEEGSQYAATTLLADQVPAVLNNHLADHPDLGTLMEPGDHVFFASGIFANMNDWEANQDTICRLTRLMAAAQTKVRTDPDFAWETFQAAAADKADASSFLAEATIMLASDGAEDPEASQAAVKSLFDISMGLIYETTKPSPAMIEAFLNGYNIGPDALPTPFYVGGACSE